MLNTAGENTPSTIVSYKPTFNLVLLLSNLTSTAAAKLKLYIVIIMTRNWKICNKQQHKKKAREIETRATSAVAAMKKFFVCVYICLMKC